MFVYVISHKAGVYKIGFTSDLRKRFSKTPKVVVATIPSPNPHLNEKMLHKLFSAARTGRAEYFKLTDADLGTIKALAAMDDPWPVIESLASKVTSDEVKCQQCGNSWIPRVKNPVQCPRCKRVDWKRVA